MTEAEVLEKLASYKDAIIRIKTERNEARQKAEELQQKVDTQNVNYMQDSKESWEKADHWERLYNDLKEKSYHTIKHLVEDNIEPKEVEIAELRKDIEACKGLLQDSDYAISNLVKDGAYVVLTREEYQSWESKDSEAETRQTVLEATVKEKTEAYELLQNKYNELKAFSESVQTELQKVQSQNGIYKSDVENLQKQLEAIQKQSQQTKYEEQVAKDNFMKELSRVMNEASEVLKD